MATKRIKTKVPMGRALTTATIAACGETSFMIWMTGTVPLSWSWSAVLPKVAKKSQQPRLPHTRFAATTSLMRRVPGVGKLLKRGLRRVMRSDGKGPDSTARTQLGSHIVALAYDGSGRELARADLVGVHGYTFTANILAIFACWIAEGRVEGTGALDPVTAVGLETLVKGCAEAGLELR